jgi:ATP-dependent helicase/nuclease subunit A
MGIMPLPADQEARDRALQPRESFHLEAPAGSGKTSVLLARFLTLLTQVEAPEELLALTFTRKAAGELRARVMRLLWSGEEPGPEDSHLNRQLWELARQVFQRHGDGLALKVAPERLPIMTFHSFCAQLLRLAPQEAGLPLEFQLLEDEDAAWLKEEAVEELRRRLAARPPDDQGRQALVRRLVRLNNDWPRLSRELQGLLSRRDSLKDFLELASLSREPSAYKTLLEARFHLVMTAALQDLAAAFAASALGRRWPEFWRELQDAPLAVQLPPELPGAASQDLPTWQAIAQALLTQGGEPRRSLSPKYGFPAGLDRGWVAALQDLPATAVRLLKQCQKWSLVPVQPEEVPAFQDLVILLGEALTLYEELCAQRKALDFIALEEAALRLLDAEDPGDLLLRLDRRVSHVLVDEFQDTSENQMLLLCRLLSGWVPESGRSLVVVGDPKQSIYGWRQAKVRLFVASRQGVPCGPNFTYPLKPLLLTTNFRASRRLIAWANGVFGSPALASGVEFHPAVPGPGAPTGEPPELALFGGQKEAAREAEARWLAREVAQAAAALTGQETIGILFFARTHLKVYLKALNEAGLAVRVKDGLDLLESPVVQHLHNLARALVRPQDEVAWAATLRGPWSQEPLGTLARAAQTPGLVWPEKLARLATEKPGPPALAHLVALLTAGRSQTGRQPLAEILAEFLDKAPAWDGIAAWEGPPGVANARAYLSLLAAAETGLPEATFRQADFQLKSAFQPPDPRAQDSPVEVLTVHGAKGLEFDQVFLPFLDWQPLAGETQAPPFLLEEIPGTGDSALALARPYVQEKQSSLYLLLRHLRDRRVLDEARRVFYVAVTRARRRLVLSGVLRGEGPGGESPLTWLWRHYQPAMLPTGAVTVWSGPELRVAHVSEVPALTVASRPSAELPAPWEFKPEPLLYRLEYPSQLAAQPGAPAGGTGEAGEIARVRGEVTHRLLEAAAQGRNLPGAPAVAAALRQAGLPPEAAGPLAPEILTEVAACLRDPFLAPLLAADLPRALNEWALEDQPGEGVIRRGKMDRLVCRDGTWWLLDYKTSRPEGEEGWEEFIRREAEKYRPQLLAYREMAARALGVEPGAIRLVLYFTARQRAVELY